MVCWWFVSGLLVVFWWFVGGLLVVCWWFVGGLLVVCWCFVDGLLVVRWWFFGGLLVLFLFSVRKKIMIFLMFLVICFHVYVPSGSMSNNKLLISKGSNVVSGGEFSAEVFAETQVLLDVLQGGVAYTLTAPLFHPPIHQLTHPSLRGGGGVGGWVGSYNN